MRRQSRICRFSAGARALQHSDRSRLAAPGRARRSRGWPTPKRRRQNFGPKCSITLRHAVVARGAAVEPELHAADRQVELVVGHEHVLGRNLVVVDRRAHRLAAQVHVGLGFNNRSLMARDRDLRGVAVAACVRVENWPPCSRASSSTNQKPALCRVAAYSAPGLPSPTINSICVPTCETPLQCKGRRKAALLFDAETCQRLSLCPCRPWPCPPPPLASLSFRPRPRLRLRLRPARPAPWRALRPRPPRRHDRDFDFLFARRVDGHDR